MAKLKITLIVLPLLLFLIYQYGLEVFLYGLCAYIQRTKELPPNIEPRFWNYDGEKEGPFTHRFVHINQTLDGTPTNVTFHYVEVGDRKNPHVAMFHGASETWYQWHHQLDYMKNDFYMVAFDLKLFGQSSKPKSNKMWPELNELGGNYTVQMLGDEIMAALDKIGLKKFHFITFDLGSYCLYRIPAQYPDRIITYTKMQSLVGVQDIKHMPQFKFFQYAPHATAYFMSTVRDQMVRSIYGWPKNALTNARVYRKLPEEELERIVHEYSYPDGNPLGWVSYVNSLSSPFRDAIDHYQNYTMPVFILQGANDPAQPPWYYDGTYETVVEGWAVWPWGMYFPSGPKQITRPVENGKKAVDFFPKAPVALYESVAYSGHFLPLERPDYTSESIRLFLKGKYDEIRKRAKAQPKVEAHSCTFTFGIPSSGCNERDLVDDPMATAKKEKSEL